MTLDKCDYLTWSCLFPPLVQFVFTFSDPVTKVTEYDSKDLCLSFQQNKTLVGWNAGSIPDPKRCAWFPHL